MSSNKVSIVITCYNDHKYLTTALDNANAQNWDEKEIILVDDGSNTITKKLIEKHISKIDILITQENLGVSAARNRGIEKASGTYILVWDCDDYFERDFISKALKKIDNKKTEIVTCYSRWFASHLKNEKIFKPRGGDLYDALFHNVAMGSALFKKKSWEKVNGYDENMILGFEDWEFYIRLLKDGGHVSVIPEVLFNYRNTLDSRNDKANLRKYDILDYIYLKHADLYKENFTQFVKNCLSEQRKKEKYKHQISKSSEYKIGRFILKPFRLLGILE